MPSVLYRHSELPPSPLHNDPSQRITLIPGAEDFPPGTRSMPGKDKLKSTERRAQKPVSLEEASDTIPSPKPKTKRNLAEEVTARAQTAAQRRAAEEAQRITVPAPKPDVLAKSKELLAKAKAERDQAAAERMAAEKAFEEAEAAQRERDRQIELQKNQEKADKERVEALRSGMLVTEQEGEASSLFNEAIPLSTRRGMAERKAADAMEKYLKLKAQAEKLGLPKTEEERRAPARIAVNQLLVRASQELDAALLRESFAETDHPKAEYDAYLATKAQEKELRADTKAMEVRKKLEALKERAKEDHLLPSMIDQLPPDEREEARKWYNVESSKLLTESHLNRLRKWHETKSALDLAKVDLVEHCKTCNIPEEYRQKIGDPRLDPAKRDGALLKLLSDGYVREFDQPKGAKEWATKIGLGIAHTFGFMKDRKYVKSELNGHMQKIAKLEEDFNAVADTKGAFVGRRPIYQNRDEGLIMAQNPNVIMGGSREPVIGNERFTWTDQTAREQLNTLNDLTAEATKVNELVRAEGVDREPFEQTQERVQSLVTRLQKLSKTFAVDSGEYHMAQEAIKNAEAALTTRINTARAAEQKALREIGKETRMLERFLDEATAETLTDLQVKEAESTLLDLALRLGKTYDNSHTTKAYAEARAAITDAEESLRGAKALLASRQTPIKKPRSRTTPPSTKQAA